VLGTSVIQIIGDFMADAAIVSTIRVQEISSSSKEGILARLL
jgi:hypothetical protein